MTDTVLRARSTSEIVDAAFALYRQYAAQFTMLTAICYVPMIVATILTSGTMANAQQLATTDPMAVLRAMVPVYVLSMFVFALLGGAMAHMGSAAYLGGTVDVAATLRATVPRVPSLVGATLLFALMLVPTAILLFLPALYLAPKYFAINAVIVLENKGAFKSFARAGQLSKGRVGSILVTLLLVFVIYLVMATTINLVARAALGPMLSVLVSSLFTIVTYPIVNLVVLLLYYDCRIRAEGFDVEHMSASLGAVNPSIA